MRQLVVPIGHLPLLPGHGLDDIAEGRQRLVDLYGLLLPRARDLRFFQSFRSTKVNEEDLPSQGLLRLMIDRGQTNGEDEMRTGTLNTHCGCRDSSSCESSIKHGLQLTCILRLPLSEVVELQHTRLVMPLAQLHVTPGRQEIQELIAVDLNQ